ncbi:MAG: RNA-binding S4 domain-containing protein [Prolixibacteraceae bacterium]|nr:RNA-binding S4 domain-containing protein [Prolixibacteraceae bacterium]MBN2774871.1 RNA-binding S4 domain-containing protein [Prolixibacteraceae bacterium]
MVEKEIRIDKWLWAVRVYKTRSQATEACRKGHVSIGALPVKPSRIIKENEIVEVRKTPIVRSYRVVGLAEKRMSAKLAEKYITDITPPEQLEIMEMQKNMSWFNRQKGTGRPTKKDRREIDDFFNV